ncbi:MAG TPA: sulfotransferase [Streptosporangiaceae bacterium]|nr:sulfotransferase [Streptosporangiaceae bacterium]
MPHILIVNSRNVVQPVFVIGAPHAGADIVGRLLKAAPGLHVTIGQPSVLRVVYAFARRPSMHQGRSDAAASVLRDAFAQAWQVSSASCLDCGKECRTAAGLADGAVGPCVEQRGLERFGDASPDLLYCAEALTSAFADARIVQVIRDGRHVVASMLADPAVMHWFRPSFVNTDTEFPNPFFGIESAEDLDMWPSLSPAARCALRWRWAIRLAARLRRELPAEQLHTIRYEELVARPRPVTGMLAEFTGLALSHTLVPAKTKVPALDDEQRAQIQRVAGDELRRLGYS